jgi:hypothetical protein
MHAFSMQSAAWAGAMQVNVISAVIRIRFIRGRVDVLMNGLRKNYLICG